MLRDRALAATSAGPGASEDSDSATEEDVLPLAAASSGATVTLPASGVVPGNSPQPSESVDAKELLSLRLGLVSANVDAESEGDTAAGTGPAGADASGKDRVKKHRAPSVTINKQPVDVVCLPIPLAMWTPNGNVNVVHAH